MKTKKKKVFTKNETLFFPEFKWTPTFRCTPESSSLLPLSPFCSIALCRLFANIALFFYFTFCKYSSIFLSFCNIALCRLFAFSLQTSRFLKRFLFANFHASNGSSSTDYAADLNNLTTTCIAGAFPKRVRVIVVQKSKSILTSYSSAAFGKHRVTSLKKAIPSCKTIYKTAIFDLSCFFHAFLGLNEYTVECFS